MKNTIFKRFLPRAVVLVMVAVMIFSLASCGIKQADTPDTTGGAATISVTVTHGDGTSKVFNIETREGATLRSALESVDLISGDEGQYGLYVKIVDGERADYDADGAFWGFYQDGQYMMDSVDLAKVKDGDAFEIRYEKQ